MTENSKEELNSAKEQLDIDDILRRVDSLPILDPRSPDEILDYDENGLPS